MDMRSHGSLKNTVLEALQRARSIRSCSAWRRINSFRQSTVSQKRKYYSLTDAGRQELKDFFANYRELADAVQRLADDMEGLDDE